VASATDPVRRIWKIGLAALIVLAALIAGILANAVEAAAQRRAAERIYIHTLDVLLSTSRLEAAVHSALRGERGYLLTGDPRFLLPYTTSRGAIPRMTARLAALTRDNPRQRAPMAELSARMAAYFEGLDTTVALQRAGRGTAAQAMVRADTGRARIDQVLDTLGTIEAEERRLLRLRHGESERANARTDRYGLTLAGLAALLLLTGGAAGASALRNRRLVETAAEFARIAATDALTGLPNRRAFWAALQTEIARAGRSGEALSLAIIDIDHFKRVNDRHGHPAGDTVLAAAADKMRAAVRAGDVIGRIGGEEFAILMPATTADGASLVCERLRAAVESWPVDVVGTIGVPVTVSTGIAMLADGERCDALVARADKALYKAKTGGRNQIKLAA
jgi:diguanylate cyclase (GGDEF)-like protein